MAVLSSWFKSTISFKVGLAAVQLAKAYGMKVLGTAGTAEGEEVVKQAGASQAFNHRQDGYVQNILVLTLLLQIQLILCCKFWYLRRLKWNYIQSCT